MTTAWEHLPGGSLITRGVSDWNTGKTQTVEALLVRIAFTRLRALGVVLNDAERDSTQPTEDAELRLFRVLRAEDENTAYARYKSLVAELASFVAALENELK